MKDSHVFDCATAPERASKHWKQGKTTWGDLVRMVSGTPSRKKESGNYLLGKLRKTAACSACRKQGYDECLTRTNQAVVHRGALMLDADSPTESFLEDVDVVLLGTAYILHTTYSSAPDQPRYRLIIPTAEVMDPETFGRASRAMMQRIGIENFDRGSDEPARYMFKPGAQQAQWYSYHVQDGGLLSVPDLLNGFEDDLSATPFPKPHRDKRDPYTLEGIIGDFNRAYQDDLKGLIDQYELPYVPAGSERWQLVGSSSQAGMGEIEPGIGLYYSYHANDPAFRQTCSAFDLVRIHRFGELDAKTPSGTPVNRLPSHEAMLEHAQMDPRVIRDQFDELDDSDKWQMDLQKDKKGVRVLPTIQNYTLIRDNDPVLKSLRYNEITFAAETGGELPWRDVETTGGPTITETDRARIGWAIWGEYNLKLPKGELDAMIDTAAQSRWYNPIKDYLLGLSWDGQPRLETCLPAEPDGYVRLVARKSLVAAVARALNPGCKWDHTLVLVGPQGIGKTFWVETMSKGWFGQLGKLDDKDTLLAMQRSWIMTSDEAHTLRKAESEQQKEFLTRTEDVFRLPYERTTRGHPRRCVVWGTTNDEIFLRQQEGNRRFLPVNCTRLDFPRYTEDYIDQVWAEAVALYRGGERLYLTPEETTLVLQQTAEHVEEDTLTGRITEYLNDAENVRNETCTWELWEHALGNYNQEPKMGELRELFMLMKKLPGWRLEPSKRRMGKYGPQRWFARTDSTEDYGSDIL
jgi:predicted P-loop ATPase